MYCVRGGAFVEEPFDSRFVYWAAARYAEVDMVKVIDWGAVSQL